MKKSRILLAAGSCVLAFAGIAATRYSSFTGGMGFYITANVGFTCKFVRNACYKTTLPNFPTCYTMFVNPVTSREYKTVIYTDPYCLHRLHYMAL